MLPPVTELPPSVEPLLDSPPEPESLLDSSPPVRLSVLLESEFELLLLEVVTEPSALTVIVVPVSATMMITVRSPA